MKTITATELKHILDSHALWIRTDGAEGTSANLVGANLEKANLEGANLYKANLYKASLFGTILEKKTVSVTFGGELNAKIADIESFLDKHGMKLASPISILPK